MFWKAKCPKCAGEIIIEKRVSDINGTTKCPRCKRGFKFRYNKGWIHVSKPHGTRQEAENYTLKGEEEPWIKNQFRTKKESLSPSAKTAARKESLKQGN